MADELVLRRVREMLARQPFVSRSAFEAEHPSALAFWCSDGRFTDAVGELLKRDGDARLDTMTLPGGPGLLAGGTASECEADVARASSSFLIVSHRIRHVVLVAHKGCGYYAKKLPGVDEDGIRKRQVLDLMAAASLLRRRHPWLKIESYYALPYQGKVAFVRVPA